MTVIFHRLVNVHVQGADKRVIQALESLPRSRTRTMLACAKSSSWCARPRAFSDLLVVEIIEAPPPVALVDHVEEHIGGVGAVT